MSIVWSSRKHVHLTLARMAEPKRKGAPAFGRFHPGCEPRQEGGAARERGGGAVGVVEIWGNEDGQVLGEEGMTDFLAARRPSQRAVLLIGAKQSYSAETLASKKACLGQPLWESSHSKGL